MKPLSSGTTGMYRVGAPLMYVSMYGVALVATRGAAAPLGVPVAGMIAYTIWFGRRLSEVWLDGDALQVKGPATFRVPLADVLLLEAAQVGRGRMLVLGLDHPVGKVQQVRFIPASDAVEKDLQARIHAARSARRF